MSPGLQRKLLRRIAELKRICAESYQAVGILAYEAGRFDDPAVIKALDNLSRQQLVHDDVLPFPSKEEVQTALELQNRLADFGLAERPRQFDPDRSLAAQDYGDPDDVDRTF